MKDDTLSTYALEENGIVRHRPLLKWLEITLLIIGALFWVDSITTDTAFNRVVYGSIAYALPAWFWAAMMMGASMLCINGLLRPVHHSRVVVGALVHAAQFAVLALSAAFSDGETIVLIFSSAFSGGHLLMAWEAWKNGR